jgi:hypothetical protein
MRSSANGPGAVADEALADLGARRSGRHERDGGEALLLRSLVASLLRGPLVEVAVTAKPDDGAIVDAAEVDVQIQAAAEALGRRCR